MTTKTEIIQKVKYVASDGYEFDKESDCVIHEAKEKLKSFKDTPPYQKKYYEYYDIYEFSFIHRNMIYHMKNYFNITEDAFIDLYKTEIKNETDLSWLITFCESKTGEKHWSVNNFEIGKKYLLCVVDLSTMMKVETHIYFDEYERIMKYHKSIIDDIQDFFE